MGMDSVMAYVGITVTPRVFSMASATVGTSAAEQLRISWSLFSRALSSSSANCRIWRCMVGTAEYHVGSGMAWSAAWKFWTAKTPGMHLIFAPATAEARTFTMRPWMWKRGMVLLHTSSPCISTVDAMQRAPHVMFACVSGTIFGFFVVPEVWSTSARSSRLTVARGLPMGSPLSGLPTGCFAREKSPANSSEGFSSSSFSTLVFRAMATALLVFVASCSSSLSLFCTMRALAGRSMNSNSYSSLLSPMFSGAKVQRSAKAKKQTAASGPFGIAVQSLSSRLRPGISTASLTMNSLSCLKLTGFLESVPKRNGASVSGRRS
mmetsp:Transcript_31306/g.93226  ORF Transcript_31306/g.93226 Transcript_31306/m.93226 type:complete len:321 (+) Transcript_31306:706-1668(+)